MRGMKAQDLANCIKAYETRSSASVWSWSRPVSCWSCTIDKGPAEAFSKVLMLAQIRSENRFNKHLLRYLPKFSVSTYRLHGNWLACLPIRPGTWQPNALHRTRSFFPSAGARDIQLCSSAGRGLAGPLVLSPCQGDDPGRSFVSQSGMTRPHAEDVEHGRAWRSSAACFCPRNPIKGVFARQFHAWRNNRV